MDMDHDSSSGDVAERMMRSLSNGAPATHRRDPERTLDRAARVWELPGTQQDPNFINKRIDNARQPFTIFEIIRDQQQSLTGANLTTAFTKLAHLTTMENVRHAVKTHKVFKEMTLTAAQNSKLFSDEEVARIIWALAHLDAEPPIEVMDTFMCNFYARMDKLDIKILSMALWGLARLDYIPAEKVLIRACQAMAERIRLREGRLSDFASCFWALAVMGYAPLASILDDFVALSCSCLGSLTPLEAAQLLWSFIQFGLHPGQTFLNVVDALFCGAECMWSIDETALLFWGMATYAYPLNQLFIFKAADKVHSLMPNCSWTVLVRTLSACARMCYHPGERFLQDASVFLSSHVDELYYEAIETVLWSYATFSFHPGCDLLAKLASKIEGHLSLFSALHLANVLWCFALFDSCSSEMWKVMTDAIRTFPIQEMPHEALYRLFQVYLLKKSNSSGEGSYDLPGEIKESGSALWTTQLERQKELQSPFSADVYRILSSLRHHHLNDSQVFQHFLLSDKSVCVGFYIESLQRCLELVDEHEFTINTTEPIGSAIMRTKITQCCLERSMGSSFSVDFLKYTDWQSLGSDNDKQQYLKTLLF